MRIRLGALALCLVGLLAACDPNKDLTQPPVPFGDFRLGFDIIYADNAEPVGPSRAATADEWEAALDKAIKERFGRYDGEKLYHLGIAVNNYALAVPGIPLVVSPKSVLVISVSVWDDSAQRMINPEAKRFTVFEGLSGQTVVGSGLTRSAEEQMEALSRNAAREINKWLIENKAWFTPEAVAARALLPPQKPTIPGTKVTPAAAAATSAAAKPAAAATAPAAPAPAPAAAKPATAKPATAKPAQAIPENPPQAKITNPLLP